MTSAAIYARVSSKRQAKDQTIGSQTQAGVRTQFVKGPRGDSPEDQLLIQFQGIFAEYEKAQLAERYRRGKAYRARSGSVNVLGGAPFGYRYVRKTPEAGARYEVIEHEAVLVAEQFRRYADDGATIADLARWLTGQGIPTRTGKHRWDRSVIWGMLRNPAYAGRAVFGKTQIIHAQPGLNRVARLQGRTTPRPVKTVDRPREEWTEIPVPAIVDEDTFARVQQRLEDNKKFATRNSTIPPNLLQGLAACAACGYGYYRTSARIARRKIYYYRFLGSDDYRYEGGRICGNKPIRADYLDQVVWDHITGLLADPALIRAEMLRQDRLRIGRYTFPESGITIQSASGRIEIGDFSLIGPGCYITDADHRFSNKTVPVSDQGMSSKGSTVIEDNVWLGANVVVTSGVRVGRRSVIGANSVVTRDIPAFSVAAGIPPRSYRPSDPRHRQSQERGVERLSTRQEEISIRPDKLCPLSWPPAPRRNQWPASAYPDS